MQLRHLLKFQLFQGILKVSELLKRYFAQRSIFCLLIKAYSITLHLEHYSNHNIL